MDLKFSFYSQSGEDFLLNEFFGSKSKGFYIDIGAFDGIHLSNSYFFEKAGWEGICVEANPEYFKLCQANRKNSICLNVACVGDPSLSKVKFYQEELGLLSGINPMDDVKERYEKRGLKFSGFQEIEVDAMTLNSILFTYAKNREIDFISMDVEGTEIDILKGLDLASIKPRVLIIESNTMKEEEEIHSYMLANNYYKGRSVKQNVFYLRDKADVEKLSKIIIDCEIEKTIHPLGKSFTKNGKAFQKGAARKMPGYWTLKKIIKKISSQ